MKKNKRGRPRKTAIKTRSTQTKADNKIERRGRPKGSKNKKAPKGLFKKMDAPRISYITTSRFIGYCSCGMMMDRTNIITMTKSSCPRCGKISKTAKLKSDIKIEKVAAKNIHSDSDDIIDPAAPSVDIDNVHIKD